MKERMLRWLVFGVLLAFTPLVAKALLAVSDGVAETRPQNVLIEGQILLVGITLAAAAIGELIGVRLKTPRAQILMAGIGLFQVLVATFYFVYVDAGHANGGAAVAVTSSVLTIAMVATAAVTMHLVEEIG